MLFRVYFRKYHKGGKTEHKENWGGQLNIAPFGGSGGMPPRTFLDSRSSEIDSDAIWSNQRDNNLQFF